MICKHPTIADKYKVKELAQDQTYSRGDLQLIEGTVEDIPVKPKKKRQTEKLSLTEGAFSIEAEKQTQREKRERKKIDQFDFNVAGLNDKSKRAKAKKAANVTADSKRKGKKLLQTKMKRCGAHIEHSQSSGLQD